MWMLNMLAQVMKPLMVSMIWIVEIHHRRGRSMNYRIRWLKCNMNNLISRTKGLVSNLY
uniref:Uncharacterized protein n=1 Tax=Arundo donax TaxID=35708 RepID=A0A0A9DYR3_ARUDO